MISDRYKVFEADGFDLTNRSSRRLEPALRPAVLQFALPPGGFCAFQIWRSGKPTVLSLVIRCVGVLLEDFAFAGMIGRTDNALLLHAFDQGCGAVIADLQAALDVGGRGAPVADHHFDGLAEEVFFLIARTSAEDGVHDGAVFHTGRLFQNVPWQRFDLMPAA